MASTVQGWGWPSNCAVCPLTLPSDPFEYYMFFFALSLITQKVQEAFLSAECFTGGPVMGGDVALGFCFHSRGSWGLAWEPAAGLSSPSLSPSPSLPPFSGSSFLSFSSLCPSGHSHLGQQSGGQT